MPVASQANERRISKGKLLKQGVSLLGQQIWCWGRDILREEGNWLIELGFERLEPPADRDGCSSVYSLEMSGARRVVLRGFGVFYGDDRLGGVFLPRYEFRPRCTPLATLEHPPWSNTDMPKTSAPDASKRDACVSLTLDLIDWVQGYEETVVERLGIEYRQATLDTWKHAKGAILPADGMANAWRTLGLSIAERPEALIP